MSRHQFEVIVIGRELHAVRITDHDLGRGRGYIDPFYPVRACQHLPHDGANIRSLDADVLEEGITDGAKLANRLVLDASADNRLDYPAEHVPDRA